MNLGPLCLDDIIGENNPVRAIAAIVDRMEIPSQGFVYGWTKETGRKPYDPADMFKLYAYGYFNGLRSSRRLERECARNIEVMWLTGSLTPHYKTIANFRRDNKEAIKKAFRRFSLICDELGLLGKEMVAVDGSKFRANNGRGPGTTLKRRQAVWRITGLRLKNIWNCWKQKIRKKTEAPIKQDRIIGISWSIFSTGLRNWKRLRNKLEKTEKPA